MDITNATLVRIDDERVITIDGVKYLVLSDIIPIVVPGPKPKKPVALPYPHVGQAKDAILEILKKNPGAQRTYILSAMKREYGLEPSVNTYSRIMRNLSEDGLIKVEGTKKASSWSLVEQPRKPGDLRGL